jgi:hypothetical protein
LGLSYFSAHLFDFRKTCGQLGSATSPSVANSGRVVANESDDATIAAAIVATRVNLLMTKRIDDPVPRDQFVINYFQYC